MEDLQTQVDQRCIDWYNRDEYSEPPMDYDGPDNNDTPIDSDDKSVADKKDMVYLNISIVPIELTGDEGA